MRVSVALFPAAAVTLALFCLMQYLITGSREPVTLPDYRGFVHLIHLQQPPDPQADARARRAPPERPHIPEQPLQPPQPLMAAAEAPDFPALSLTMPGLASLDLDQGPYLAPPEKHTAARPGPVPETRPALKQPDTPAVDTQAVSVASATPPATPGLTGPAGDLSGTGSSENDVIPLFRIDPDYPRKAARARQEGWVKIEFTITERGTVVDPVVVEARPRRVFNRSALAAIRQWQFKPKVTDGKPVSRRVSQVIEFKLANR